MTVKTRIGIKSALTTRDVPATSRFKEVLPNIQDIAWNQRADITDLAPGTSRYPRLFENPALLILSKHRLSLLPHYWLPDMLERNHTVICMEGDYLELHNAALGNEIDKAKLFTNNRGQPFLWAELHPA
jgi:hypothetical protein